MSFRKSAALLLAAAMVFQAGMVAWAQPKSLSFSQKNTEASGLSGNAQTENTAVSQKTKQENYWLSQFTGDEKEVYSQILEGLKQQKSMITVSIGVTSSQQRQDLFAKVMLMIAKQHPEYYWLDNTQSVSWKLTDQKSVMTFRPSYNSGYDKKAVQDTDAALQKLVKELGKQMPESDYEKLRLIYTWVLDRGEYNWEEFNAHNRTGGATTVNDYNLVGIMLGKKGICQSYADSVQYLCNAFGLECVTLCGTGNYGNGDMDHYWNYVKLDESWYLIDTTWGDTFSDGRDRFFLLGSGDLVKPGVTVEKAYRAEKNSYFTYPELSKSSYQPK